MRRSLLGLGFVVALATGCNDGAKPVTKAEPAGESPAAADPDAGKPPRDNAAHAQRLAQETIILDGHVDVPYRLESTRNEKGEITEDISAATPEGDFDFPRAREGGLDAPFMSIYVPAKYEGKGAKAFADKLIDMVETIAKKSPDKFVVAHSPQDVQAAFAAKKVALPMGMENGAPLEGDLANVAHFHGRGIRYITLTHSKDNHISDSSFDEAHTHKGLSAFGKEVVAEMNRVGIMIDVSHISDDAFWQVMALSKVPVIASHSSCRHFTPGFERNMSDDMIKTLAKNGGVIQINFGSMFIDDDIRKERSAGYEELGKILEAKGLDFGEPEAKAIVDEYRKAHPTDYATIEQVADHIDHVVQLVGADHVGFGSDFDGVGDSLPTGLKDVSDYPNLIRVLLERGYSDEDIAKIAGANVLRVWQAVEDHAGKSASPETP